MKALPILKSARRFLLSGGNIPDRDVIEENLGKHCFREPLSPHLEASYGWVNPEDILSTDFSDLGSWTIGSYVVLTFREDKINLPKSLIKAKVKSGISNWCREHGKDRCPAKAKAEIRERIEEELLKVVPPTVRSWSAVWNIQDGWVALQSCPDSISDIFRKSFFNLTGLLPENEQFEDGKEEDVTTPFRAWLIRRDDEELNKVDVDGVEVIWNVQDNLSLSSDAGKVSAPGDNLAASVALANGAEVTSLRLQLTMDDGEYLLTFGKNGRRMGMKLPSLVKGDNEEAFLEALFLYERVESGIRGIFNKFLKEREYSGNQGIAAENRWRTNRAQSGWDNLLKRLEAS